MPGEMYEVYRHYKSDEWERFLADVTEWDLNTYWIVCPDFAMIRRLFPDFGER